MEEKVLGLYTQIKDNLQKDYPSAQISLEDIAKNNEVYKGLKVSFERSYIDPVFNLSKLAVNDYSEKDIEILSSQISREIKQAIAYLPMNMNVLDNYEKFKTHLCADIIQQKGNEDFLKSAPFKPFGDDMAIIAKAILTDSIETSDRLPIITITNEMLEALNVDRDILIQDAIKNSDKINPPEILMASDFLYGDSYLESPETHLQDNAKAPLRILTTQTGICKASALLSQETLEKLANQFNGNYHILPSSIGCFAVPDSYIESKNFISALEKAFLENNQILNTNIIGEIYHYSHDTKVLEPERAYEERNARTLAEQKKDSRTLTDKPKIEKEKDLEI